MTKNSAKFGRGYCSRSSRGRADSACGMGATPSPFQVFLRHPKVFWLLFLVAFALAIAVTENFRLNKNLDQLQPFFLNRALGLDQKPPREPLPEEPAEPSPQGTASDVSKVLWPDDPDCSGYDVRFGQGLNRTLLLSFPRSGNTWTRYLLEAATGVFTGSVYHSGILTRSGFLGEQAPDSSEMTIVEKTHHSSHAKADIPTIMLLRNPARSCISFFSFRTMERSGKKLDKHLKPAPLRKFSSKNFRTFVPSCVRGWLKVARAGLTVDHLLPIYYEHLREDPIYHIQLMLQFLGIQPDEGRMKCLAKYTEGEFKAGQLAIDPYTPQEKEAFGNAIATVDKILREKGFKPLPEYSVYQNRK